MEGLLPLRGLRALLFLSAVDSLLLVGVDKFVSIGEVAARVLADLRAVRIGALCRFLAFGGGWLAVGLA